MNELTREEQILLQCLLKRDDSLDEETMKIFTRDDFPCIKPSEVLKAMRMFALEELEGMHDKNTPASSLQKRVIEKIKNLKEKLK